MATEALERLSQAAAGTERKRQRQALDHLAVATGEFLHVEQELWAAAFEVRETRAWEADPDFMEYLDSLPRPLPDGQGEYTVFMDHRCGYRPQVAKRLAQQGAVLAELDPAHARASGQAMLALSKVKEAELDLQGVWNRASSLAADDPKADRINTTHVSQAMKQLAVRLPKKGPAVGRAAVQLRVRAARKAVQWLITHDQTKAIIDFQQWMNEMIKEHNRV